MCVCVLTGAIKGMGIKEGVTLVVGGGFHGKSTILQALQVFAFSVPTFQYSFKVNITYLLVRWGVTTKCQEMVGSLLVA